MRATDDTIHIPATVALIPTTRHRVAALLADHPRVHDAEQVAAELLTDAVRHSHGSIIIHIVHEDANIRIEVHDQRRHHPRPTLLPTDPHAPDPLALVSLLADQLGSSGTHGTTYVTTWATLHTPTRGDTTNTENDDATEYKDVPCGIDQTDLETLATTAPTTQ